MGQQTVVIKSNRYGITLFLDKDIPFQDLLRDISDKFRASSKFFKGAKMAVMMEGRNLSQEEQLEIVRTIQESSSLEILCILEQDTLEESYMKQAVEEKLKEQDASTGRFYKGTLRSGQVLESETSIIILGDVNPGATVVSKGSVIVLGTLKGMIHAGAAGNEYAFVAALHMMPVQIKIADVMGRSDDRPAYSKEFRGRRASEPKIAYAEDGKIYMELITKEVINDIRI